MAQEFMADVRLRCVHRSGAVSDVLRGMEDTECQAGQEVTRGKESFTHGERNTKIGKKLFVHCRALANNSKCQDNMSLHA